MLIGIGHRLMEITLGECLQCKLKRLQEESDAEFKKRYGFVDSNRAQVSGAIKTERPFFRG